MGVHGKRSHRKHGVSSLPKTLLQVAEKLLNHEGMTYANGNYELRLSILSHHLSIISSKPSLDRNKDGQRQTEAKEGRGKEVQFGDSVCISITPLSQPVPAHL